MYDTREAYDAAAEVYDDLTAHHDYDGWTAAIEAVARRHGLRGTRLLDVGCGTGKSFMPFLGRGYEVTACDLSPAMLRLAAAKAGGAARLFEADVRRLPRVGGFDLVLALDDVVNYLPADDLPRAFARMAANLARTGLVVFDANTELTFRTFFAGVDRLERDGRRLTWRGHVDPGRFRAGGHADATLSAVIGERRIASRHRQYHHPPGVLRQAIADAGLRCAAVLGQGLDGVMAERLDEAVHTKSLWVACARSR